MAGKRRTIIRVRRNRPGRYVLGLGFSVLIALPAWAGPAGEKVVRGKVRVDRAGDVTTITASNKAVINYRSFDIASGETVRFVQPGASAKVLNRIQGSDPTNIAGTLTANGRVYIVNPAGVYFREGSLINVGALYAAAGNLTDKDFVRGVDRFSNVQGIVQNDGSLLANTVVLAGRLTRNHGVIETGSGGTVVLASGNDILLGEKGGNIFARIQNAAGEARSINDRAGLENLGTIRAPGGRTLVASGDTLGVAIHAGGSIRAKQIALQGGSAGTVRVEGSLDASSSAMGGSVAITGSEIEVVSAEVNASGALGGGSVLIGGGVQGGGGLAHARSTVVNGESTIRADATVAGDGGTIVAWSDGHTEFKGAASAIGAGPTGAGGLVETSGKQTVDFGGARIRASASGSGAQGQWLIDPTNQTIGAAEAAAIVATLNAGTPVAVATNVPLGGGDAGNIAVNSPINATPPVAVGLTFDAANNVAVSAGITSAGSPLNLTVRANQNLAGDPDPNPAVGGVQLGAAVSLAGGAFVASGVDFVSTGPASIDAGSITLDMTRQIDVAGAWTSAAAISVQADRSGVFREDITAPSINLWVGQSGIGGSNLTFASSPVLRADTIMLRSGRQGGAPGSTVVNAASGNPTFGNQAGTGAPSVFVLRNDGLINNARTPAAARFIGGTPPDNYSLITDNHSVSATDPSKFAGANLTISTFSNNASLGHVTLSGGTFNLDSLSITAHRDVQLSAITTANGPITIAGRNLNLSGAIDAGTSAFLANVEGDIQATSAIRADTSIALTSGNDGIGNLNFFNSANIDSASITLTAGDGLAGGGIAAAVDAVSNAPNFRGPGGAGVPTNFTIQQDASIGDAVAPAPAQFGGGAGPGGINYSLCSFDGNVTLATASKFAGANLSICGPATGQNTISADFSGANTLAGLTVGGPNTTLVASPSITATGAMIFQGVVDVDTVGNAVAFTSTGSTIAFQGALNSLTAGEEALVVSSAGGAAFGGPVGAANAFASLMTTGPANVAADVATAGGQTWGGPVLVDTPGNSITFTSTAGGVAFNSSLGSAVNAQETLNIASATGTTFGGAVGASPNRFAGLSVAGPANINGGSVTTTGNQSFGAVALGADTILSGGSIGFTTLAGGGNDLTLNNSGAVTLGPAATGIDNLIANGGGVVAINGNFATTGAQIYNGPVNMTANLTLASTGGGNLALNGITTGSNLNLDTAGTTILAGTLNLTSLTTDAAGSTQVSADIATTGGQTYNDAVTIVGTRTISSTGGADIAFTSGIAGQTLLINTAGVTILAGPVNLTGITTDAGGSTRIGGNITTTGDQTFCDAVVLTGDAILDAGAGRLFFCSTIDSDSAATPRTLTLRSQAAPGFERAPISFGGSIGAAAALNTLNLNTGIPAYATPPTTSTIVMTDAFNPAGEVVIDNASAADAFVINAANVVMSEDQKLLVLGGLTMNATASASLGDVATLGDLAVNSPSILLVTRKTGSVAKISSDPGNPVVATDDTGVDFVAGGVITFSSVPIATGGFPANAPTFCADTPGSVVPGMAVSDYEGTITIETFRDPRVGSTARGLAYDLRQNASLPPVPPQPDGSGNDLGSALNRGVGGGTVSDSAAPPLAEPAIPDTAMRDAIERLDLFLRGSSTPERVDGLSGRTLYVDRPPLTEGAAQERRVASPRVSVEMLRAILDDLAALDADIGGFRDAIFEELRAAGVEGGTVAFDAEAFARRVASLAPDNAARRAFDLCARLFDNIDQSGLTPAEAAFCKRTAVKPLCDNQPLTADQLLAAVEAYIKLQRTVAANQ